MESKNILTVAIRIGAIVLAVNALQAFPNYYGLYLGDGEQAKSAFIAFTVVPTVLSMLFAIVAWFFPQSLLKTASFGKATDFELPTSIGAALFACIGLFLVLSSLVDLAYNFSYIRYFKQEFSYSAPLPAETKANLIATILELLLGVIVLVGNRGINKFFVAIRT
ncbi:hypothetical protein SAMN03080615_01827 [Amphritea atlantica]|uniref:Uncharacterized protein n=1 Tax=Amphritea atlantica TaxID=355243 RepID=A0A1H9GQH1_9GAMM|nr:hypothetical protein [Amphritea atlantica]SEQ52300.1 hypothetical protein SAMN03080615_01827 [Amphritea atlantica]